MKPEWRLEALLEAAEAVEAAAYRWGALSGRDLSGADQVAWEEALLILRARRHALRQLLAQAWADTAPPVEAPLP